MPMVFEQQPRESNRAFAAFSAYLEMGAERSLAKVGQKLGKSTVQMEKWSAKFDWPARVKAHGAHLANIERKAIEGLAVEKAIEWHKLHEPTKREMWQKADEILALADDFLKRWRNTSRVPGFESVVRGIELAFKLRQVAAGMPTEIKEVKGEIKATLEVEWELALRKVYGGKAAGSLERGAGGQPVIDAVVVQSKEVGAGSGERGGDQRRLTSAATGGGE